MQSRPVTSRIIKQIYFSPLDGELRIRFQSGEERRFSDVPETEVTALCKAVSPGRYYLSHIRHQFKRLAA